MTGFGRIACSRKGRRNLLECSVRYYLRACGTHNISDRRGAGEPFIDISLLVPICGPRNALSRIFEDVRLIAELAIEKFTVLKALQAKGAVTSRLDRVAVQSLPSLKPWTYFVLLIIE